MRVGTNALGGCAGLNAQTWRLAVGVTKHFSRSQVWPSVRPIKQLYADKNAVLHLLAIDI
jgi:hypothetical protein